MTKRATAANDHVTIRTATCAARLVVTAPTSTSATLVETSDPV
jgi:hypothetical protein